MRKIFQYPAVLALLVLSSCNGHEVQVVSDADRGVIITNAGVAEAAFCKGAVNVRVSPDFAEVLEAGTGEDAYVDVRNVKSMNHAIADLGIVSMTRLFPEAGEFEARTRAEGLHLWYNVKYDPERSLTKAGSELSHIPGIEIIDYIPEIVPSGGNSVSAYVAASSGGLTSALPFDDPLLDEQWHFYNTGDVHGSLGGCDINVVPVWKNYTTGNPDVIVAVVDGGIDYRHEDLAANMWHDPQDSRHVGYNFCEDNYVITPHSHGTHVAGIVAAVNNNGVGVCGIAGGDHAEGQGGVRLMSCQIFSDGENAGSGERALKWAADNGAVIAQNSWGPKVPCHTSEALKAAVNYFEKYAGMSADGKMQTGPMAGGLVVFAAGNNNAGDQPYGTDYEKILSVTSVGADFRRADYSNYGEWNDLAAPGGDVSKGNQVVSTLPDNRYGKMQGTSMACPHVAGVAALVLSAKAGQGYTPGALRKSLEDYATDISAYNRNAYLGVGLVNAYRSIAAGGGRAPEKIADYSLSVLSNTVGISAKIPSDIDDGKPNTIIVYYSEEPISSPEGLPFIIMYVGDRKVGESVTGYVTGLEFSTEYYFAALACDLSGNKSPLSEVKCATTGINRPPFISTVDSTSVTLKSHETRYINFTFSDPDGHYVRLRLDGASEAEALDTVDFNAPRVVITGKGAPEGTYRSRVVATDIYGLSSSLDFDYCIKENHPPHIVSRISDYVFGSKSASEVLEAKQFIDDQDGEQLKYSVVNSSESVVNVNCSKGKIYITALGYGYADITLTGTDALGKSASLNFRVLVRDAGQPLDVYPNPVTDRLYVRAGSDVEVVMTIVNVLGAEVCRRTLTISPFSPAMYDTGSLPAGSYTVILEYAGSVIRKNIVKI